jgi:hypothetical protein
MRRTTRRMIERLEPFAELPKKAPGTLGVKVDGDDKDGGHKELAARQRRSAAAKPRAK